MPTLTHERLNEIRDDAFRAGYVTGAINEADARIPVIGAAMQVAANAKAAAQIVESDEDRDAHEALAADYDGKVQEAAEAHARLISDEGIEAAVILWHLEPFESGD